MAFKVYRQHDSMQCGIACLQMVCAHHGREYSSGELSRICFATVEGVSMLGISERRTSLVTALSDLQSDDYSKSTTGLYGSYCSTCHRTKCIFPVEK